MRIVKELDNNILYVDVCLSRDEIEDILENNVLAHTVNLRGQKISLGVALDLSPPYEEDYAVEE